MLEEQVNQQPSIYLSQLQAAKEREISAGRSITRVPLLE